MGSSGSIVDQTRCFPDRLVKTTSLRPIYVYGTKAFISGGSTSDVSLHGAHRRCQPKGISCVLVEKDRGVSAFGSVKKTGWHSQPTTMVFFENCRIPVTNR